jgi:hypothetical protein
MGIYWVQTLEKRKENNVEVEDVGQLLQRRHQEVDLQMEFFFITLKQIIYSITVSEMSRYRPPLMVTIQRRCNPKYKTR